MVAEAVSSEKIKIDSRERLRSELGISPSIEIPEITQAFEVTRKDIDDFRRTLSTLPTQDQLEKIKVFIAEKSKVVSETKDQVGDFKKAFTVAGTGAILSGAGVALQEGIVEIQNAEGMDKLEKASSLWDNLGKTWDNLILSVAATGFGRKILEFFGIDIPATSTVPDASNVKEVIKKPGDITEEKIKEIDDGIYAIVKTDLIKQYGLNPDERLSDGTTKGEKLKQILKKRTESMYSLFMRDPDGYVHVNADNIAEVLGNGPGLIYDLVKEGVLDASSMTFDLVSTAKWTIRYVVKTVSGVELPVGMSGEISLDKIDDTLSMGEKMFLMAVFYRKGWFVTSILGDMAYMMTQPMRLLNYDNVGTRTVLVPGFTQKIEKMDQVIAALAKIAPENADDLVALREMRSSAESTKKALEIVTDCKEGKLSYEAAKDALNTLQWNHKGMHWFKNLMMQASGLDAWNKAFLKDLFIDRNETFVDTLIKSISPEAKFGGIPEKIKWYFQFLEIPGDVNRTTMYFKNPKDFSEFMKEMGVLASQTPEFVRGLFSHLPVFVVGGMVIHEGMKPDGEVGKALLNFIPIVWPILMMREADVAINPETWKMEVKNIAEWVAWAALLGLDGFILTRLMLSKWAIWALEFAIKPVVDTTRAISSLIRLSGTTVKVTTDGLRLGAMYLSKFPGAVKAAAGVLAAISVMVLAGTAFANDPDEIKKKLMEEGLIDAEGKPNILRLKEKFKWLKDIDKKQILDIVAMTELSAYAVTDLISGTDYKGKMYIIKTKKEHRRIVEKALLGTGLYSEFELVDNIRIETVEN